MKVTMKGSSSASDSDGALSDLRLGKIPVARKNLAIISDWKTDSSVQLATT